VYEDAINATSTDIAPWYVIPADHKWVARTLIADIITTKIRSLDLQYPQVTDEILAKYREAGRQMEED